MLLSKRAAASTALSLLLVLSALAAPPPAAQAHGASQELVEVIYAAAAEYGVSGDALYSIAHCESSHFRDDVIYGPTRGAAGEIGIAQLHPRGLLQTFYNVGFSNPWDPSESMYFMGWAVAHGLRSHWNC